MNRILEGLGPVILFLLLGLACGMAISEQRFKSRLHSETRRLRADLQCIKSLYDDTAKHLESANEELMEFGTTPFAIPGSDTKYRTYRKLITPGKKPTAAKTNP